MHFSLQTKQKNVLKNPWVIFLLFVVLVGFLGFAYISQGIVAVYVILGVFICTTIAVSIKSLQKRSFQEFDTIDQGIIVKGKTYPWSKIKYYSWYGEKPGDGVSGRAAVGVFNYDRVNLYKSNPIQIIELNFGIFRRQINLQIDLTQVDTISSIFTKYGVKHMSVLQKVVGL